MKFLGTRTVVRDGRICHEHLIDLSYLGRGRSRWVGPVFPPDPAPAAGLPDSIEVTRANGRPGRCDLVGLHGTRCHVAVEFGYCAGGCSEWLLREAAGRSGEEIAGAVLDSLLKTPQD